MKSQFTKEETEVVNKHMKIYSTPSVIRETNIIRTMGYHFTFIMMTNCVSLTIPSIEDSRKWKPLYFAAGSIHLFNYLRK